MFHKRKYTPINPQKYEGNPNNIIMRSSWETRFASWCDKSDHVIKWKSEETVVPYRSPIDDRIHRYFIDFTITIKDRHDQLNTYLVEIKPKVQTQPPKFKGRRTKRYQTEKKAYIINTAKWKAAEQYALDRGQKFIIINEDDLGLTWTTGLEKKTK